MPDINDPKFIELITKGIPLKDLEAKLKPKLGLDSLEEEIKAHGGFGDFSEEGFLDRDENLLEVVYSDWKLVESLGLSHLEIADSLEKLIKQLIINFKKEKPMPNPKYVIRYPATTGGSQRCPWECKTEYEHGSGFFFIYESDSQEYINQFVEAYFLKK